MAGKDRKGGPFAHFFSVLTKKYPGYKSQIKTANDVATRGVNALDKAYPTCEGLARRVSESVSIVEEQHLEQLGPLLLGAAICFFGGCFTMLIAVVEVVRLTSWENIKESSKTLYHNYLLAREASLKDDTLDEDQNGIPDVQEMTGKELFSRKMNVFLSSVNPTDVSLALNALFTAFLSVLAALRVKFANLITFGCALADSLKRYFPLEAVIEEALPPKQKKIAGSLANMVFNFIGMTVASIARPYIVTMHCAVRGATLFTISAIELGREKGLVEDHVDITSPAATALVVVLTVSGFLWQASQGFALTFPFNVLLFPLTVTDWILDVVFRGSTALA